jgi:outer membrane protein assembly factor BamB
MAHRPLGRRLSGALAAAVVAVPLVLSAGPLAGGTPSAGATPPNPAYTWPKYGYSAGDTGVSPDPTVSSANASQLGLRWMAPDQTGDESSPIVAHVGSLGATLVYQGNESGSFTAFNATTGATVWSDNLGTAVTSTPLFNNGSVWVARSFSPVLYKLNAATGNIQCKTAPLATINYATPTIGTPPGEPTTIFIGENGEPSNAPVYAINAATCQTEWQFTNFNQEGAGTWDPYSYGTDADGNGLLLFGDDNPDSTVYAVNAVTGQKVWSFATQNPADGDVGTGASITAPGVNGFADGAAYISNNGGYTYALDLTTGQPYWSFDYASYLGAKPDRGTAAVAGDNVILPGPTGVLCLNAQTGAVVWNWTDTVGGQAVPSDSAAAVVGPPGQQVVAVTDLAGQFDVLDAQTGNLLYQAQTGGYAVTSVAEAQGNFYVSSGAGFLYDFGLGGTSGPAPTTTVTSPASGAQLSNPAGDVSVTGTAQGPAIGSVDVAIQSGGGSGPWWDAATSSWNPGFVDNPAHVATPGATATSWTLNFPVPTGGGTYQVLASAVSTGGQADISAYQSPPAASKTSFTVDYSSSAPVLTTPLGTVAGQGGTINVAGSGYSAGESVAISLAGTTLATPTADGTGSFVANVVIPTTAPFGLSALVGTGQTSGLSSSAAIDVLNQWAGLGDTALHQGYATNDLTWDQHIVGNHSQFITQAWSYASGAPITTSTAVVGDVAYFANSAGTVSAVNVQTGQALWTTTPGGPLDSSPAVAAGLVVLGTKRHTVVALSATNGAVVWSTPTTSAVESAPAISGSTVYVGSDSGTVYALNLADGSVVWQQTMGGSVKSSPAVDPATGEVVVSDLSGEVTALSAASGSTLWASPKEGAFLASPTIDFGNVYIGSENDYAYAFNETTGAPVWSYKTTASIQASGAYWSGGTGSNYYVVGNVKGQVVFLQVRTGAFLRQLKGTGAVTGISNAEAWVTATFGSGMVIGNKFPDEQTWEFQATGSMQPAALANGVLYTTGADGTLRAFTVPATQIP